MDFKKCSIVDCPNKQKSISFCGKHYTRIRKYGNPYTDNTCKPSPNGFILNGYRVYRINHKPKFEHRIVIEKYIDRELSDNEIIHHKNGDKLDNRIGNLEIITRSDHKRIHRNPDFYFDGISKSCSRCKKIKLINEFYPHHRKNRINLYSHCKVCCSEIKNINKRKAIITGL